MVGGVSFSSVSSVRRLSRPFVLWSVCIAGVVVAGWWGGQRRQAAILSALQDEARHSAVAFSDEDLAGLSATPADLTTPAYRRVKARLLRLRHVIPGVRFVYLFRTTGEPGRVVFLADSDPDDSSASSRPGDAYPEAAGSPGLQSILADNQPSTEGPLRDAFGEWVTAYALVGEAPPPGAPKVILGVDLDSPRWRWEIRRAALVAGLGAGGLLGLPWLAWWIIRRERQKDGVIRRLSTAIQQSHSGVIVTDLARNVEYVNDGCLAITGYQREEVLGRPARLFFHESMNAVMIEEVRQTALAGRRWQGEVQLRHRAGWAIPVRAIVSPVRDDENRVVGTVAIIDDISEEKRTNQELQQALARAELADRAKGEFLAVMTHELRTPLNGIIGFAALLHETKLTEEQREYVETIHTSGEALLTLTNEVLDYSRMEAGQMQLSIESCELRRTVEDAVEALALRAAEKSLELLVDLAPELPEQVLADAARLRQVLINLISNSIKFTAAGEVVLQVRAVPVPAAAGQPAVRLEFAVHDTGIGIPQEQHARLFLPFGQLESSNRRRHGGAGLGLAISRHLVELMGGEIAVESQAGHGSIFRFHFVAPVVEPATPLPALPAVRAWVIGANENAREFYRARLAAWGLEVAMVEPVDDWPAAGELPAVVLVDLADATVASWVARRAARPEWPVARCVGLAPVGLPAGQREALNVEFGVVVPKPVREALLHAAIRKVLAG